MEQNNYPNLDICVYTAQLENGLKLAFIPKKGFTKTFALYATRYGSIDNRFKVQSGEEYHVPDGIAHFLEHKLFEQPDGSNVFDEFTKLGASANASTGFDMTAYLFSATDNIYESLEVLLDYVQKPYFTPENIAKEQGIIGQEINMYNDSPQWKLYFNLLGALYQKHTVAVDIAGTIESIAKIDKFYLDLCYKTFYHPSNMAICIVGDIDPTKAVKFIEERMIKTEAQGGIDSIFEAEPREVSKKRVEQQMAVSRPMFGLGVKTDCQGLKAQFQWEILVEYLLGRSTKKFIELYKSGLIDNTFSPEVSIGRGYSFVAFTGESDEPDAVAEKISEHILASKTIDPQEAERAKRVVYGKFIHQLNSIETVCYSYTNSIFHDEKYLDAGQIITNTRVDELEQQLRDITGDHIALSIVSG